MYMRKQEVDSIESNGMAVPKSGSYTTESSCAELSYTPIHHKGCVLVTIDAQVMNAHDIKELRKFLKILEREIK